MLVLGRIKDLLRAFVLETRYEDERFLLPLLPAKSCETEIDGAPGTWSSAKMVLFNWDVVV